MFDAPTLLCKVIQRVEATARKETFLILTVAALDFAVVPWGIRTNEFMSNAKLGSRLFKQRRYITFAVGKAIGELKAVVRLDAFHLDAAACIPRRQLAKEIR